MIQNTNILPEDKRGDEFLFESCHDDGEYIWFSAYRFNGLFKCSKETWVAEYLGQFPGERRGGVRLFSSVAECGGKLYFAPMSAESIAVYDLGAGAFGKLALREVDAAEFKNYSTLEKFAHAVTCGAAVYLIPGTYPAIICIDTENDNIAYITDPISKLESIKNETTWYLHGYEVVGKKIFVTARCANAILEIDADNRETKLYTFEQNEINYYDICYDGASFWLATVRTTDGAVKIGKWDGINFAIEFVEILPPGDCESFVCELDVVFRILYFEGRLYVIPCHMDRALRIDLATNEVSTIGALQPECRYAETPELFDKFNAVWKQGDEIYALGGRSRRLYILDAAKDESRVAEIRGDTSLARAVAFQHDARQYEKLEDSLYGDSDMFNINAFIEMLVNLPCDDLILKQSESAIERYEAGSRNAGAAIYAYCRDSVMGVRA
jgi:hypothetical protein